MQTKGDEGTGGFVIPATMEMVLYHIRQKCQISKLIHQIEHFILKIRKNSKNKFYSHFQKWQSYSFMSKKKVAVVPWCGWKSLYPSKERPRCSYPPPV